MIYGSAVSSNKHASSRERGATVTNFADFFTERESLNIRLPVEGAEPETKFIGNSFKETFHLNKLWLLRLFNFFMFYVFGCLFFVEVEGWTVLDCIFFITQTISTVGYGNITPVTTSGRIFASFYMYVGVLAVFSVIGDLTNLFVIYMRKNYKKPAKLDKVAVITRGVLNCLMWIIIQSALILFGALIFSLNEGWSFQKGFYFATVSSTSVGFGDLVPQKTSSIWINIFYILISVSVTALSLQKISSFKRHIDEAEFEQMLDTIELSPELLDAISSKDHTKITSAEFVLHMLQLSGKIDQRVDIVPWLTKFKEYDLNHDGFLTSEDVELKERQDLMKRLKNDLKKKPKRKSVLQTITDETKNVILETLKIIEPEEENLPSDSSLVSANSDSSTVTDFTPKGLKKLRIRKASLMNSNTDDFSDTSNPSDHPLKYSDKFDSEKGDISVKEHVIPPKKRSSLFTSGIFGRVSEIKQDNNEENNNFGDSSPMGSKNDDIELSNFGEKSEEE